MIDKDRFSMIVKLVSACFFSIIVAMIAAALVTVAAITAIKILTGAN